MKHLATISCLVLVTLVAFGEEKSQITVRNGSTANTGVVIVTAKEGKKTIELQCNRDVHSCTIPDPGSYWMVRLPKNHGLYDCANVELYQGDSGGETEQKIGEYCLTRTE
jgi:hypothetical protein